MGQGIPGKRIVGPVYPDVWARNSMGLEARVPGATASLCASAATSTSAWFLYRATLGQLEPNGSGRGTTGEELWFSYRNI